MMEFRDGDNVKFLSCDEYCFWDIETASGIVEKEKYRGDVYFVRVQDEAFSPARTYLFNAKALKKINNIR